MDLHRVLEGESLAPFPVLRCLLQESLSHNWGPSQSRHDGGVLHGELTPSLAVLLLQRGLQEPFPW